MRRDLPRFAKATYDVLVIGGGIYGACVAWDACLRGLSVALVEKNDFGSATSANSLKVIHGGLRYLQHGDLYRMRQSILERKALLRIAPHLIHPLPVLVPTYGYGLKGREVLTIALKINDLISSDRNTHLTDPQKFIPNGQTLSRSACLDLIPGISPAGLTGGAVFYDAQVYNSERLLMAFLHSASLHGVDLANYAEVVGLHTAQGKVTGATVKDRLTGDEFDIQATTIVNTSGPWVNQVLGLLKSSPLQNHPLAKAVNIVTRSLFDHPYAVGISSRKGYRDRDALINKGSRFFFVAPWRDRSLVGTAYLPYSGKPDDLAVTEQELSGFLNDFNVAYPPANLKLEDVSLVHQGLLPSSGVHAQTGDVQLTKHYHLHDHRREGVQGLLSVVGVKYTTARGVAQTVVDRVFQLLGKQAPPSTSATMPLYGGQIGQFDAFLQTALQTWSPKLPQASLRRLIYSYGSAYPTVLTYLDPPIKTSTAIGDDFDVLKAEVRYGIHEEMAQTLSDVVLRRGELGSAGQPDANALKVCAETMAAELGWSLARTQMELDQTHAYFAGRSPKATLSVS